MPGPSSATVRIARWPSSEAASRTRVPAGVWTSAFSTRIRPIWRTRSASPRASTGGPYSTSSACPDAVARGVNSAVSSAASPAEVDGLGHRRQPPRVEPGQVEQVGGELREPRHLLAHRGEELLARRRVEPRLLEQLEEAAEREERRSQLVRGVGDELAAGAVEGREPQAHALEGARELADLVLARSRRSAPRSSRPRSARPPARAAAAAARTGWRPRSRRAPRTRVETPPAISSRRRTTLTVWSWARSGEASRTTDALAATNSATSAYCWPRRVTMPRAIPPRW